MVLDDNAQTVLADLGAGNTKETWAWFEQMHESVSEEGIRFLAIGLVTNASSTTSAILDLYKLGGENKARPVERGRMKAERATAGELPEYENPPVTEVVCGVLFKTLENFRLPHFGLLWKLIEKEYPACQEVAPLLPIIEGYGTDEEQQQQLQVAFGDIPLPRIWFLDAKGTGILQLQRDRLLHNWKKNKATDAYPRYPVVIRQFKEQTALFEKFLKQHNLGAIEPLQYEMTYVNHIPKGEGWNDLTELGSVFRGHQWQRQKGDFLPPIEHVSSRSAS